MLSMLLLIVLTSAQAQTTAPAQTTTPADTTTDKEKTKFFGKIGHWISAYSLSSEDFMTDKRDDFKSKAFAEVYVEGVLDHNSWMFNLLNRVTQARVLIKQTPNVTFGVKFKPKDSNLNSYTVQLTLSGGDEVKVKLDDILADASKKYLDGKNYNEPNNAINDIEKALEEAMNQLADRLGKTLAQDPMVRLQGEVFWNGHTIGLLDSDGNSIELEAIDKNLNPIPSTEVTWTNADPMQSKGVVDMTGVTSKNVTLSRNGGKSMTVTLKRVDGAFDINELLKSLIIEALASKKAEALDSIQKFKQDSIKNTGDAARLIAQIESANFQLEDDGSTLAPMLLSPLVYQEPDAFTNGSDKRSESFLSLKKRKKIRSDIRRKVNVVALADLIVDHPDQIKILLDELLKNSGRLVAQLILGKDGDDQKAAARNIVIDFLNKNLEQIAGGHYTDTQPEYPVIAVTPVTPTTPAFTPGKYVYINPYAEFAGKDSLVNALNQYLPTLDTPLYVIVNYSQDNARSSYLARGKSGRPVGLPAGAKYKVYTLVNMPGSLVTDVFGTDELTGNGDVAGTIGHGSTSQQVSNYQLEIAKKLISVNGRGFLYCKKCNVSPINLNPEEKSFYTFPIGDNFFKCILAQVQGDNATLQYDIKVKTGTELSSFPITLVNDQFILVKKDDGTVVPCESNQTFPADFCSSAEVDISKIEAQILKEVSSCLDESDFSGPEVITYNTDEVISYQAIKKAITDQLGNTFYSEVKLGVKLHDQNGNSEFLSSSGISEGTASIVLYIKVDEVSKKVQIKNIGVSDGYLNGFVSWLQAEAGKRGIQVDVNDLRKQVITDLKDHETNLSFADKAFQSVEAFFNERVGKYVEVVQTTQKSVNNIWDQGTLPESQWHSGGDHLKWPTYARMDPVIAGPSDAVIDEITGIPLAIKTLYGVMTDEEQLDAFTQMFTIGGISQLINGIKEEAKATISDGENLTYSSSKVVVNVAATFFTGGITKTGKGLSMLEEMMSRIADLQGFKKLTAYLDKAKTLNRYKPEVFQQIKKQFDEVFEKFKNLEGGEIIKRLDNIISSIGVDNFNEFLPKLHKLKDIPGLDKVLMDLTVDPSTGWKKFKGAKFVVDYVSQKGDEFISKIDNFELAEEILIDGSTKARVYDMFADGVRYEFKNWNDFYPSTIRSQFIKDLTNPDIINPDQIKWVFNKTPNVSDLSSLKSKVIAALKKADGTPVDELKQLDLDRVKTLLDDELITEANKASKLLNALNKDDFFDIIFEVAN
jgi:hypothetical protein